MRRAYDILHKVYISNISLLSSLEPVDRIPHSIPQSPTLGFSKTMTVIVGLVLSLVLSIVAPATAWGSLGHRAVAYLAQKHFTADGAAFVNNLLDGEDISDAALWPDQIRRTRGWTFTAGWHFIGRFVPRRFLFILVPIFFCYEIFGGDKCIDGVLTVPFLGRDLQ